MENFSGSVIIFKKEGFHLLMGVLYAMKMRRQQSTFFFTVLQLECFGIFALLFLASIGLPSFGVGCPLGVEGFLCQKRVEISVESRTFIHLLDNLEG